MRRVTRVVFAVAGLVGVGLYGSAPTGALAATGPLAVPGALAAPAPSTPAGGGGQAPAAGKPVCTVSDTARSNRLVELSGLAATSTGYVTVNDSSDLENRKRVFFLDKACKVIREVKYETLPSDPEDLAVGKDDTVWVADIGDNPPSNRQTIGLWKVPPNSNVATLFRMRYPDGKFDAEALLLDANDQPIIVTKGPICGIYTLKGPLTAGPQGTELQKVGEFKPKSTGTSNKLSFIGQTQVTGGANSPDRKKVVLRTYSDAYEWDVPDGDVVKAITTGEPRITPLPDEPWGEAITYSPDGATFLTVSETAQLSEDAPPPPQILQYTPATEAKPDQSAGAAPERNTLSWYERLSLDEATWLVAAVGAIGVLLVVVGVVGILHTRRSRASTARAKRGGDATGVDSGAGEGGPTVAVATQNLATPNAGGHVYYAGGSGNRPEAGGSEEQWRRPGHTGAEYGVGTEYGGGRGAGGHAGVPPAGGFGGQPGYGPGNPPGQASPGGYPPPAGR